MKLILNQSMQEATEALIANLLASEAFIHYQQAQDRLNEDHQAHDLLEHLSRVQADIRKKQASNSVTQSETQILRSLQVQVQHNPVITIFAQTQEEAVKFLREINEEISQLLGINFASFANHNTC